MNRTPAFLCQWHHCRTLHTGQYSYDFFQFVFWSIHQYIFLSSAVLLRSYGTAILRALLFLFAHVLVANQQCFRLHYNFHFFQAVADQSRTGTYNIKMASANPIPETPLPNRLSHVFRHLRYFFQEVTKNNRIRGSNLLAFKP